MPLVKNWEILIQMMPELFLVCQRMRVCEEVTSNIIPRNFAKIMLCLRHMINLEEKGLRQSSVMVCGISNKTD